MASKEIGKKTVFGITLDQVEKLNNCRGLLGSQRNPEEVHI